MVIDIVINKEMVSVNLLLAEDEEELSKALKVVLNKNEYMVDVVKNGKEALECVLCGDYDVIILDIMMPVMDGLTALKKMRLQGINTPVILLTAKGEVEDRIIGLDCGADDYLPKPFAMGELLARLRALCRRRESIVPEKLVYGDIYLDKASAMLGSDFCSFRLTSKEYQIMELLIANAGNLISTERLLEKIWGYDTEVEINVVWVTISALRKKMQGLKSNVAISAVRGLGYTLTVRE